MLNRMNLKRVIRELKLTHEQFLTVVVETEGILNSRPFSPLLSDRNDFNILTPGHFLIGRPINYNVEPELIQFPNNRLKRWEIVKEVIQIIRKNGLLIT